MKIKPIASGSSGNAYLIESEKARLLIDCGIPFDKLKQALDFNLPDVCLVSHAHNDHSYSADDLRRFGVRVIDSNFGEMSIGGLYIKPLKMVHDVDCYGFYITEITTGETLFFATDTAYIPYQIPPTNYIMVECNHDAELMYQGELTPEMEAKNKRVAQTHMSIDALLLWLSKTDLSKTKRIYLLHLSDGNSDEQDFKNRVMAATGVPVTVCQALGV